MVDLMAVRIAYHNENRNIFNLLAELFRLVGLYVEELSFEDIDRKSEKISDSLQLLLYITSSPSEDSSSIFIDPDSFGTWDMSNLEDTLIHPVRNVIEQIRWWTQKHHCSFPCDELEVILPVYIRNNLLKGAMQLQYYRMKMEEHKETEEIFLKAVSELESLNVSNRYFAYAKLYCRQKVNLSCYFQFDKPLDYAISDLLKACNTLIEEYPEFSNAKVLKGMICERSSDGLKLAIDSYLDALMQISDKIYASHVFYWAGLLYQKYLISQDEARYAYERSYTLKKKYRNTYKLGYMAEQEGNYVETVKYYQECMELLETKIATYMDPLEIEYYFKTGVLIAYHSQRNLEDYEQSIAYGEKMISFYEAEFPKEPSPSFRYFYGSEAKKYQEISKKRLKCKKLYECLAVAYREMGEYEKSMKYWEKAKKFEEG